LWEKLSVIVKVLVAEETGFCVKDVQSVGIITGGPTPEWLIADVMERLKNLPVHSAILGRLCPYDHREEDAARQKLQGVRSMTKEIPPRKPWGPRWRPHKVKDFLPGRDSYETPLSSQGIFLEDPLRGQFEYKDPRGSIRRGRSDVRPGRR
jgi:hypothetical protein